MESSSGLGVSRSQRAREELAKAWLLDILERTPVSEVQEVPVSWIVREGPGLIENIMHGLGHPVRSDELALPADGIERVGELARLRPGHAQNRIPRDLAALQALLIESLRYEIPERRRGSFAESVTRLAEIFGDIQAQVGERATHGRSHGDGAAAADRLTGFPGTTELREWIELLLAEQRQRGEPFSLVLADIEGLARINQAYGQQAGDRMLRAVAAVIKGQIGGGDRAFRLADDELCVVLPGRTAEDALPVAERLCALVDGSQAREGPRVAIAAGLASCPEHGFDAQGLLNAAEEATWAAKAAGRPAALAPQV